MPRLAYEDWNPKPETEQLVLWADAVARNYRSRGLGLTIRQLYYQGVSQDKFPNSERSYQNLIRAVSRARLAGKIDWDLLEDRGRTAYGTGWHRADYPDAWELARNTSYSMTHDLWEGQENRIEVWVEKQALEEVAERATQSWRLPYIACKGYMSQSEMWSAGHHRLKEYIADGQHPIILHIGDHDPSGIDMTRDIAERLTLFAQGDVEVRRLALNWDQIEQYSPPPNPAKLTDSRAKEYIANYGRSSWELDALRPEVLIDIVKNEIGALVDQAAFDAKLKEEREVRAELQARWTRLENNWDEVETFMDGLPDDDDEED